MLGNYSVVPTIPVSDLERAIDFYSNVLGLKMAEEQMPGGTLFEAGKGTRVYLYQREGSACDHTLAAFNVDNLEKVMDDLRQKGVEFEHYDLPGIKTDEEGVAMMDSVKSAWFKDPDGNILGITEGS
jgi:catechol 2,3-dioxygenase-like lactoylglutathione lyase family enzyme